MELESLTALVTGAGSGIGRAIAVEFARSGARVFVNDVRSGAADDTIEIIAREGGRASAAIADVTSRPQVDEMVSAVTSSGILHILVNNAGFGQYKPFEQLTEGDWDRMLSVHLKGAFNCTQSALPALKASGRGRIINIASVAGLTGTPTHCHYSAAKSGLIGLTKALAREVAASGITANAVAPGLTDTPFVAAVKPELQQAVLNRTPLNRMGKAEEAAWLCCFLASEKAAFITGQVISPNGGFLM
jgi:3-oxoacyl-[acyl-carrier protein] reductase